MPTAVVLSLQRAGSAGVLSLQFPASAVIAPSVDGAGGLSTRKRMRPQAEPPRPTRAPLPAEHQARRLEAAEPLQAAPVEDWDDEEAAVLAAAALLLQ